MTLPRIRLSSPALIGNERAYVTDCIDRNELSWNGAYARVFEELFAARLGVTHAVATCNGTAALHLALLASDVKPGLRVAMPTLTYVATANAVRYCGAEPEFCDVDEDSWTLIDAPASPVLGVDLYGVACGPCDIEDAAEAFGGYADQASPIGSLTAVSIFSFYANKTLTCGEGGMLVTDDDAIADRARFLRGQAQSPDRRYWHTAVGYNYRMTNMQAAIGVAQLECADEHVARRRVVIERYRRMLASSGVSWQLPPVGTTQAPWMFACLLPHGTSRDGVMASLDAAGIETRPVFPCVHQMPMYATGQRLPVAEDISARGICLPTHALMGQSDVERVCDTLFSAMRRAA